MSNTSIQLDQAKEENVIFLHNGVQSTDNKPRIDGPIRAQTYEYTLEQVNKDTPSNQILTIPSKDDVTSKVWLKPLSPTEDGPFTDFYQADVGINDTGLVLYPPAPINSSLPGGSLIGACLKDIIEDQKVYAIGSYRLSQPTLLKNIFFKITSYRDVPINEDISDNPKNKFTIFDIVALGMTIGIEDYKLDANKDIISPISIDGDTVIVNSTLKNIYPNKTKWDDLDVSKREGFIVSSFGVSFHDELQYVIKAKKINTKGGHKSSEEIVFCNGATRINPLKDTDQSWNAPKFVVKITDSIHDLIVGLSPLDSIQYTAKGSGTNNRSTLKHFQNILTNIDTIRENDSYLGNSDLVFDLIDQSNQNQSPLIRKPSYYYDKSSVLQKTINEFHKYINIYGNPDCPNYISYHVTNVDTSFSFYIKQLSLVFDFKLSPPSLKDEAAIIVDSKNKTISSTAYPVKNKDGTINFKDYFYYIDPTDTSRIYALDSDGNHIKYFNGTNPGESVYILPGWYKSNINDNFVDSNNKPLIPLPGQRFDTDEDLLKSLVPVPVDKLPYIYYDINDPNYPTNPRWLIFI